MCRPSPVASGHWSIGVSEFSKLRDKRDAVAGLACGGLALIAFGAALVFFELWGWNGPLYGGFVVGTGIVMLIRAGVLADRAKKMSDEFRRDELDRSSHQRTGRVYSETASTAERTKA